MGEMGRNTTTGVEMRPASLPGDRPSGGIMPAAPPLFDFRAVLRVLRRRWPAVVLFTIFCLAVTALLDATRVDSYSAKSRILLDEQSLNPFGRDEEIFEDLKLTNPVVESQMQLMRSPLLLSQVVRELDLHHNEEFMGEATTPLRTAIGDFLVLLGWPAADVEPMDEDELFQAAVSRLRDNVAINRNALTLVLSVEFSSASPELSADVVNGIAEAYINNRLDVRQSSADKAAGWFDARLEELSVRIRNTEARMELLRGRGRVSVEEAVATTRQHAARSELQRTMDRRSLAQAEVLRLTALLESELGLRGILDTSDHPALHAIIQEAEIVRLEREQAAGSLPLDDPILVELDARIAALEDNGRDLLREELAQAQLRVEEATRAETAALAAFEASRSEEGQPVPVSIDAELRTLEGEARIYRQLHERYLYSYLRTVQQKSFPKAVATIIEKAQPPEFPAGPSLRRLAVLGLLIGLTVGTGGAFLLETADGRVRSAAQLANAAQAPVLGLLPGKADREKARRGKGWLGRNGAADSPLTALPEKPPGSPRMSLADPKRHLKLLSDAPEMCTAIRAPLSRYSETLRRLKAEVDAATPYGDAQRASGNVIGFISDQPSAERSIAAANFAQMLAIGGSATLLVDFDWNDMYLSRALCPTSTQGVADLDLSSADAPLDQALWYEDQIGLHVLPNRAQGGEVALSPAVFDPSRLKQMVGALLREFDDVVLDLSPLAMSSDASVLSEVVTHFALVSDWKQTREGPLTHELSVAGIGPPKLVGAMLAGVSASEVDI